MYCPRLCKYAVQFCLAIQIVCGLDKVIILNPPEEPVSNHLLKVLYSCDIPAIVQLECVISFDTGKTSTLLLRQWTCVPGRPKVRSLKLSLPDWLVYQADWIVPDSQWVLSSVLRALLRYGGPDDSDASVLVQDVATLRPVPSLSRPHKQHQLCPAWSRQMLSLNQKTLKTQCPVENETVYLLSSIYASTGENFGITKTLRAYSSEVLEYLRLKAVSFPWCIFSIWVFVTRHCQQSKCGVLYHLDSDDNYDTPALFLTSSGHLHVQMNGESGASSAFLCTFKVPLGQWCHFSLMLRGRFRHDLVLDDTKGYFVIGGGKYMRGVEGFYGPLVYYRNRIPPHSTCEPWETTIPQRRHAAKLARLLAFKHGGREVTPASVGRALYSSSLRKLGRASSIGAVSSILPLLLQAGCLGHNQALHLSSVLYNTGLGVQKQPDKAWLLALMAAQKDSRLALLHLGHLHHQGDHGVIQDPDLAFAYYFNIAKQTSLDRLKPSAKQKFVESIYLNHEEELKLQTNENHHIFQWLKLQARNGAAEAEQAIGRMLFWGQRGVSPNIQKAVRHYERGAVRLEDPVSMYDYAIVLIQGQGVEKDIPRAVTFLKKAVEQGFAPAINALGWYYEQIEKDYERAVQLWEQADRHGSPDAAMNLGVMYSQGLYPGKAADQFTAYKYYKKSAQRGHISGALLVSEMWATGIPGHVDRHPSDAVLWAKWAAEHNGYLGSVLRKALDSYLKNDMLTSLLYYLMAAESGFAVAQFNMAYLCEQNRGGFLDPAFAARCMKRYYNLTIQSENPNTYAHIRMGDLFYEEGKDMLSAAQMYKLAALRNEPQGWYNLGVLAEEGYRLPLSVLIELGLPTLYLTDNNLLLTALYRRCRDSETTDSYLPCSLALFNVYLQSFQKDYSAILKVSSAVAVVVVATPIFFMILGVLRGRGLFLH
ncbi:protein sel-1 homolog 3 [Polymixia lowei]